MANRRAITIFVIVAWIALVLLLMLFADEKMSRWVAAHPLSRINAKIMDQVRWPGHFGFTIVVALLLTWKHALRWRAGMMLLTAGAISGLIVMISKWTAGRERPVRNLDGVWTFNPFRGGPLGFFNQTGLSFPSGDVALAFATAACLAIWFPKWRPLFYLWAILTAAQRVLSNSHYLSEVTLAAGVGIISVWIAMAIWRRWCDRDDAERKTEELEPQRPQSSQR